MRQSQRLHVISKIITAHYIQLHLPPVVLHLQHGNPESSSTPVCVCVGEG
jgi:hypothetical protein